MKKVYFKNACSIILIFKNPMTIKIKEQVSYQIKALSFKPKSVLSSGAMDQPVSKALILLKRNNTSKGISSTIGTRSKTSSLNCRVQEPICSRMKILILIAS
jgi:hypothetical protein